MQSGKATIGCRLLLAAALGTILFLATTRSSLPVVDDINDKVEHAFAFFVLAALVDFAWPKSRFGPSKFAFLIGYGIAIEAIQYFLPYRTCSLFDLAADAAGLILYRLAADLLKHTVLYRGRLTNKVDGEHLP